jgi:microcystin degradation protein MlrC
MGGAAMSSYRVLIAEFKHETNTFIKTTTGLKDYKKKHLVYGDDIIPFFTGTRTEVGGFIDEAQKEGITLIPSIAADATPGGRVEREVFNHVRDNIIRAFEDNQPIDGILLTLHGAMVLEDALDGEGELLESLRQVTGYDLPIMITLDLHANITEKMRLNTNGMYPYDHYPHIDMFERGVEAARNMSRMLRREIKPIVNIKKLPVLNPCMESGKHPHKPFLDMALSWEENPEVISVSIVSGFPYADIPDATMTVIAQTNNQAKLASQITEEIGQAIIRRHKDFVKNTVPLEQGIRDAMEAPEGPVIIADVSDNTGAGTPGDGTHVLRKMMEMEVKNAAFALITDNETVEKAIEAGVGSKVKVSLGGRAMPEVLGPPIEAIGIVKTITDGKFINKGLIGRGIKNNIGPTVVIDFEGIEVIVSGTRIQPYDPEIFRRMGIEPLDKKIIVVKSIAHYRAAYTPLAKKIIEVDAPSPCPQNLKLLKLENIRRPVFPLDEIGEV